MYILGIKVDNLDQHDIFTQISSFLEGPGLKQIATVNPEFILRAQKDAEFKRILNEADLTIADGFGLNLAFLKRGERLKYRLAGIDLVMEILKIAQAQKMRVFVATRKDGLSSFMEVKTAMEAKFEGLEVGGADIEPSTRDYTIDNYHILLCNFGAPEQEKFIKTVKSDTIKLAIGVGGSFDFLTGRLKRAPLWMRRMGLEWLFRLIQQPRRIKRIWEAVIVFPTKVLFVK